MNKLTDSQSTVGQTTRQTLRVLRYLTNAVDVVSIAEIARALGINASTVHRACVTLEATGFAERVAHTSKFTVGHKGAYLVASFLEHFPIRHVSVPFLRRIVIETGQPAELFVRIGWYRVRILLIEPPRQDLQPQRLYESNLLHRTPEGRQLLGAMGIAAWDEYAAFATNQGRPPSSADHVAVVSVGRETDPPRLEDCAGQESVLFRLIDGTGTLLAVLKLTMPQRGDTCHIKKVSDDIATLQKAVLAIASDPEGDALSQSPNDSFILPDDPPSIPDQGYD